MGGACVGDVDGSVEDALPLEQSLRALTHWWNVRHYGDVMGVDGKMLSEDEGAGFFERELERLALNQVGEEGLEGEEMVGEDEMAAWQGPVEGY